MELRAYRPEDAATILSWCGDERTFCQWTAGVLGAWPLTKESFAFVETLAPFTAVEKDGPIGFFTLRRPEGTEGEIRIGFVILDPAKRGKGLGKEMVRLAAAHAFRECGAKTVSLGVFENNPLAFHCYAAAGFKVTEDAACKTYRVLGEEWKCVEMRIRKEDVL